jgi:hypothetical protein
MKRYRVFGAIILASMLAQGCASTSVRKMSSKRKLMPPKSKESYALMEDEETVDLEILRRGNKVRGLSEY